MAAFSLDQFYRLNRRVLIWAIFVILLWLMRDFFGLIFLTFILAFIATALAGFGQRYLRLGRRFSIVLVYLCFLAALFWFVSIIPKRVVREANTMLVTLGQTEENILAVKNQLVKKYPWVNPLLMGYIRSSLSEQEQRRIAVELETIGKSEPAAANAPAAAPTHAGENANKPGTPGAMQTTGPAGPNNDEAGESGAEYRARQDELMLKAFMNVMANRLREHVPQLIDLLWRMSATMLLALLFSFLIIIDIVRLSRELKSLRASRLHDFYEQTAQPVVRFAYVVGRAFQAQAAIALSNTALTTVGLLLLGIPSVAMLSLIVFVCSFIPVLGVFISTAPIVLVALNRGGMILAAEAVGLVIVIHAIEAYLLNPIIYGKHLRLNPVLVLMILFVGHHAFGVWGMLLGVPVAYYFIHDVFGVPVWGEQRIEPKGKPLGALMRAERGVAAGSAAHPGEEKRVEAAAHPGKKGNG